MIRTLFVSVLVTVLALGCESGGSEDGTIRLQDLPSICGEDGAPSECGETCISDSECVEGTFCKNGVCDAVCTPAGEQCGTVGECISNGRCIPVFGDGGVSMVDGSVCGELEVNTDRVIPNIMIIVDRSGSMRRDFDGDCPFTGNGCPNSGTPNTDFDEERWGAVEDALVCTVSLTDGIIDTARACEGKVRLNGELLICNDGERGWRAIDGSTIELTGSGCHDWRGGDAELEAVFPCDAVLVQ